MLYIFFLFLIINKKAYMQLNLFKIMLIRILALKPILAKLNYMAVKLNNVIFCYTFALKL